jgi:hypothetical protein
MKVLSFLLLLAFIGGCASQQVPNVQDRTESDGGEGRALMSPRQEISSLELAIARHRAALGLPRSSTPPAGSTVATGEQTHGIRAKDDKQTSAAEDSAVRSTTKAAQAPRARSENTSLAKSPSNDGIAAARPRRKSDPCRHVKAICRAAKRLCRLANYLADEDSLKRCQKANEGCRDARDTQQRSCDDQ